MTKFELAQDAIPRSLLKEICERKWKAVGVGNAHAPTAWFVEFIPGFGYRISPEPPLEEEHDWGEQAFYDDLDIVVIDPFDEAPFLRR